MTDERLESLIGILLRLGVLTAAAVVATSGVLFVARHHAERPSYSKFQIDGVELRTIGGILRGSMHMQPEAMIQLGLLLLIATPILRVALAAVGFYLEGDRLYLCVSIIVLTILLLSLIHSA
jgi:uncharacterized membrane protein